MTDLPEIGYGTVNGRFLAGVLDSADAGQSPDAEPLSGYVTFAATAGTVRVVGATPAPATLFPQSVRVYLDEEGYLFRNGSRDIALLATDDPDGNPVNWQWRVAFALNHDGHEVYHAPFNFELPAGSAVDLTVVAPLASPSPGTIIIQGPPGEPGPPGDPGTGGGLKVYADLAALDLVRTGEVGTLHVDNLAAAFPNLAALGASGASAAFVGTGPADLVITSQVSDYAYTLPDLLVYQYFDIGDILGYYGAQRAERTLTTKPDGTVSAAPLWTLASKLPTPGAQNQMPIADANLAWALATASADEGAGTIMRRDPTTKRSKIVDPVDPLDIANKQYVDSAAGAGGTRVVTMAELDAIRAPEVVVLHVDNIAAAFPTLAAVSSAFTGTGPGDLVITTSVADYGGDTAPYEFMSYAEQSFSIAQVPLVSRIIQFDRPPGTTPDQIFGWVIDPTPMTIPSGTGAQGDLYVRSSATGTALRRIAAPTFDGQYLMADTAQSTRMRWAGITPPPLIVTDWGTPTGGTHVIAPSDQGKLIQYTNPGPITVRLTATGIAPGFWVEFMQKNATGPIQFEVAADAVLLVPGGKTRLAGQYSKARATRLSANQWTLDGDLAVP